MQASQQNNNSSELKQKKEYSKPIITRVQLVAGEAVLGTCKFGDTISLDICAPLEPCAFSARS